MSDSLQPQGLQRVRLPCPSTSFSLLRFMSIGSVMLSNYLILGCPLLPSIFLSIRGLPMNQLFASCGQSIGASASVLLINIQGWFPLGLTGWISLQSKGFSRVLTNTTVWQHQFFNSWSSLWSNSHTCTSLLENHSFDYMDICQQSDISAF